MNAETKWLLWILFTGSYALMGYLIGRFVVARIIPNSATAYDSVVPRLISWGISPCFALFYVQRFLYRGMLAPGLFDFNELINALGGVLIVSLCIIAGFNQSIFGRIEKKLPPTPPQGGEHENSRP